MLRLCSVYEAPPHSLIRSRDLDPVGGMQVHTARLTRALDAAGVAQVVLTAYRRGAPRIERVGERSSIARVGVGVRRFRQLYGLAAVPRVLERRAFDLVHVHLGEDPAAAGLARVAARRARAPLVVTIHCNLRRTLERHDARSRLLVSVGWPAHAELLRSASALFALSNGTAEDLTSSGIAPSRIHRLPIGIDLEVPSVAAASADARRSIVFVGRLVPEKGVLDLLEAFARLGARNAELVVVGDGPLRRHMESVRDRSAPDRIRIVGPVPHVRVPDFLRLARVVVVPSWFEERGRVVLEALAAGAPVIATGVGGIRETIRDGVNGLLLPPRRPDLLADALDRVLRDDTLARALSSAARPSVADESLERMVEVTVGAYRGALLARSEPW